MKVSVLESWLLSSLRAEGLRAESARAVAGRREDYLSRQQDFFMETAVAPERKVKKLFPRWEINRHAKG